MDVYTSVYAMLYRFAVFLPTSEQVSDRLIYYGVNRSSDSSSQSIDPFIGEVHLWSYKLAHYEGQTWNFVQLYSFVYIYISFVYIFMLFVQFF